MTSNEFKRYLQSRGCTFINHRGGGGHLTVCYQDRKAQLPMHGSRKELNKGLVKAVMKQLGLE